jgi:hypothetical protein
MERDFRTGHLEIDFPTRPFTSPLPLLLESGRLFLRTFPFLTAVALGIFLPGKLLFQFGCYVMDVPSEGILSYVLMEVSDLLLGALTAPAIAYGLVHYCRTGSTGSIAEAFRWGRRQFLRTLGNKLKVEITVTLWGALLFVPGIIAMVRLIFTEAIVAIEGDRQSNPMQRSRDVTLGHRWRIFFVLLPLMILDLAGMFLLLGRAPGGEHSRALFAIAEAVLTVPEQLGTVAIFLMYLGLVQKSVTKLKP